ncbi:Mrp/NBP35 family ATP-binding protein [bacterium]|nr:Mrp/NBP35 family ATP-binding protein [bacterium]
MVQNIKTNLPGQGDEDRKIRERMAKIKHKILVISGKGGVGKSTFAANLAYAFVADGDSAGILDIDIHGPSQGRITGIEGLQMTINPDNSIKPIEKGGVRIVTMASLLQDSDQPVIWRGPLKMKAIKQFLGDIDWGELDWLVIDSPPGTGDEPLSAVQLLPEMDGSVIITQPQDLSLLDARKTVKFSQTIGVKVLGIVENMSGFICPHCGKRTDIFKSGGGKKAAEEMKVPFLGSIPIEPAIMESGEMGKPFVWMFPDAESSKIMKEIAGKIRAELEK